MRASPKRFIRFIVQLIVLVPTTLFIVFQMFSFKTSGFRYVYKDQSNVHKLEYDAENSVFLNLSSLIYKTFDSLELNKNRHDIKDRLFFNRVPKVGSLMMKGLLKKLAIANRFQYKEEILTRKDKLTLTFYQEMQLTSMIDTLTAPSVFVKHIYFCNFTRYGYTMPIYINIVRDPIERAISEYYFLRESTFPHGKKLIFPDFIWPSKLMMNKSFESCVISGDPDCQFISGIRLESLIKQSQFFCGHDYDCGEFEGEWAIQQAKLNVEKYYSVVGVLEEMELSLQVMEQYIPRYFLGVSKLYRDEKNKMLQVNKNLQNPVVSNEVKDMLRKNFTLEMDFYEFCKQRLHLQSSAMFSRI